MDSSWCLFTFLYSLSFNLDFILQFNTPSFLFKFLPYPFSASFSADHFAFYLQRKQNHQKTTLTCAFTRTPLHLPPSAPVYSPFPPVTKPTPIQGQLLSFALDCPSLLRIAQLILPSFLPSLFPLSTRSFPSAYT